MCGRMYVTAKPPMGRGVLLKLKNTFGLKIILGFKIQAKISLRY